MKPPDLAPDWASLLDDLSSRMSIRRIATVMGLTMLSESMLRTYRDGVQPMYWRGDALVKLWCETMGKTRDQVPLAPVRRGHRRRQVDETGPRVQALPAWPPVKETRKVAV